MAYQKVSTIYRIKNNIVGMGEATQNLNFLKPKFFIKKRIFIYFNYKYIFI